MADTQEPVRSAVNRTLSEVREALHRRGRLSSRAQALDEVAKLMFAEVMGAIRGNDGITRQAVEGGPPAVALRHFVHSSFAAYLPESLAHEMQASDFDLTLRNNEDDLAEELIDIFHRFGPAMAIKEMGRAFDVDLLNEVFGKFIADSFISEKELGQYLTPPEVVDLMVDLAIAELGDFGNQLRDPEACTDVGLVLDPSCGVASFLSAMVRRLDNEVAEHQSEAATRRWMSNMVNHVLVGVDKSERMIRLALTSLAMFGLPGANLHLANALALTGRSGDLMRGLEARARLILTNPPFGATFSGSDLYGFKIANGWATRPAKAVDSEVLFIERYIDWLAPNGHCLAIVPDSILTNKGIYRELRHGLADLVEIRNVISLPPITFGEAGTNTKTSVLHFRRIAPGDSARSRTYFAICDDIGFSVVTRGSQRTKQRTGEGQLHQIADETAGRSVVDLGRYVDAVESTDRWDATFHASLPEWVRAGLEAIGDRAVRIGDVSQLIDTRSNPGQWNTDSFTYIEISDIDSTTHRIRAKAVATSEAPSRARKLTQAGDVLVSTVRPERRTIGVVDRQIDGSICTTGLAVLRPRGVHPLLLARILSSDFVTAQILRNNIGIAYPAIDEASLLGIVLPLKSEDWESFGQLSEEVLAAEASLADLRNRLDTRVSKAMERWLADL